MIGSRLSHYRILEKLGEGGMGIVFLAEDERLHRKVALKTLPPALAEDPQRLARFEREVKTVAALNHPNIVTIYSVEEADGKRFFTMEHVEGKTLSQLIPPGGLPLKEFLRIAVPLADALAAAHAKGIQHRDLKPGNVMVNSDGRVKVLDFGLAKLREHETTDAMGFHPQTTLTQEGLAIGTLAYMAPEQLRMLATDHRADLFSLGVVLYEMATGSCPFRGQSTAEVISAILRDTPPRTYEQNELIPPEIDTVLRRCLEKEPAKRFASAVEVRDALAEVAHSVDLGRTRSRISKPESGAVQIVKSRYARFAAAALAIVLLGAGLFAWRMRSHPSSGGRSFEPAAPAAARVPSLVVLPLSNFSDEPDYFVDGMTDALISSLARIRGLRVISRQSAMHYKASKKLLPQIARELRVDYVVEGSVARLADRVRLTAQIIQATPETTLWSESFERPDDDVLILQNSFASAIAGAIHVELSPVEESRMAAARKVDPEVYQEYLQGRFFVDQGRPESIEKARLAFEKAIVLDPTFAPAHAGLADVYGWQAYLYAEPFLYAAKTEAAARRAIELDPGLAIPHALLGDVLRYYKWDWASAEASYRRALDLDPSEPLVRRYYWGLLCTLGRFAEARTQIEAAIRFDPLSAASFADLAYLELFEGRDDLAERHFRRALELGPGLHWAYSGLWILHGRAGRETEQIAALRGWLAGLGQTELLTAFDALPAGTSHREIARTVGLLAEELSHTRRIPIGIGVSILAGAGELDRAERWLVRAFEARDPELVWLAMDPAWEPLRKRPRIVSMLAEMRLPGPGA
ncbi:MAG: protein kinase [Thermoanaerobaculia bacterium]|nr:protein kinase [Thermoanaerobaculia bacterium]